MYLSKFYARTTGFYLVIMSIGMFFKPQQLHTLLAPNNNAVMIGLGIVGLILGLAVVVSHQRYKGWPLLITLLGYWATIKGILIIFYPEIILKMTNAILQGNNLNIGLGLDLALGLLLLYFGFKIAKS